ncbi:MAG: hypothetical protein J6V79_01380 [Bacilli bacterium]|nr:hypothetical protein [Bacilli bacterium]
MKENRELPFQFRTWGFEIYDIINIILSVFVIVRTAMDNGPVHLYFLRGIEILASIGLIVFIMLIWKNHEEVRERRFFSLSFIIAWVGVIIQAVSAIMIIPQNLFENPLFSEIFFENSSGEIVVDPSPPNYSPGIVAVGPFSPLCASLVEAAGFTAEQKGFTK